MLSRPGTPLPSPPPQGGREQLLHRVASHWIPGEYVAGTLQWRERRRERALKLRIELFRRPAVGAMDRPDRPVLVKQINLIVAHRKNLPGDAFGAIGSEIDRQRRDFLRRHFPNA